MRAARFYGAGDVRIDDVEPAAVGLADLVAEDIEERSSPDTDHVTVLVEP